MTTKQEPEKRRLGQETYEEIMFADSPPARTPLDAASLDYVFAEVWNRPGLSRRNRRWVSLTCVGAADTVAPIDDHVYAALRSGDISIVEMREFILHFAVYAGWPKASGLTLAVEAQWAKVLEERGETPPAMPELPVWSAGMDPEARLEGGKAWFEYINCMPAVAGVTPYLGAGINNFVFGEVWQRSGLTDRDRRFITVAAVGVSDTEIPIRTHVYSALKSGHLSLEEMRELVLHFAVHSGWPKASFLSQVIEESWATIEGEGGVRTGVEEPPRGLE